MVANDVEFIYPDLSNDEVAPDVTEGVINKMKDFFDPKKT